MRVGFFTKNSSAVSGHVERTLLSGAMTNGIDRLEQEGIVVHLRDPGDRPSVIVHSAYHCGELPDAQVQYPIISHGKINGIRPKVLKIDYESS
ncbi:hypothetical protein [Leptolyngbya sp. 'hensonii']|uniref:hypothetical protein n=1 Tax=Leptolyngbya sp. 'hensonii' TaxID=1922337 RepID=UPI00209ABE65|nr:hypothetical protein [Leptolyngbya sp. 'hensonii']